MIGSQAEELACRYLENKNYQILERNFTCRSGEIDIIALDRDYIVFIEVKYRKDKSFGDPREAVGFYKQKTMTKVASYYLLINQAHNHNSRFDVMAILGEEIQLIQNAFNFVH